MNSREQPSTALQLGLMLGSAIPMWVRICIMSVSFVSFALWSTGLLPMFGDGFAKADDVKSIKSDLDETSISALRAEECKLPSGATKQFYTSLLARRQDDYLRLTGRQFPLPRCSDE